MRNILLTIVLLFVAGCAAQSPSDNRALGGNWSFTFIRCGTYDAVLYMAVEYNDAEGYYIEDLDGRYQSPTVSSPDDDTIEISAHDTYGDADVTFTVHDDGVTPSAIFVYGTCPTGHANDVRHQPV